MNTTILAVSAVALCAIGGYAVNHGGGLDKVRVPYTDHKNGDCHCHR